MLIVVVLIKGTRILVDNIRTYRLNGPVPFHPGEGKKETVRKSPEGNYASVEIPGQPGHFRRFPTSANSS